jgi:site-specific recombinase XerC
LFPATIGRSAEREEGVGGALVAGRCYFHATNRETRRFSLNLGAPMYDVYLNGNEILVLPRGYPIPADLSHHWRKKRRTGERPPRKVRAIFTGRRGPDRNLTTRQDARLLSTWIAGIGLDLYLFGTHSLRRTKATLIYRRTDNLRAVQLPLGRTKIESTIRYLGIEVDDAIAIAEQVDV